MFVIAFFPKSKSLLISWLQLFLEPKKMRSVTISTFSPSVCHEVMGQVPWSSFFECWVLSQVFHSPVSLSSRDSSSSSLSVIKVLSSAYLRLLIFLPAILILGYDSSSPAFHMMYSSFKLNKQGENIQSWCIPFLILNKSIVSCPVLTVASWSAYRFIRRQVR